MLKLALVGVVLCTASLAPAQPTARISPSSISPDGRYGVTVSEQPGDHANQLVEVASGKVLAELSSDVAFEHQNHATIDPKWSADGKTLVWYVDGKWGSFAVVVVRIENGAVKWQTNVRELGVLRALEAARKANPKAYALAKQQGETSGSWFRDGFAIEVRPEVSGKSKSALPLRVSITMTSDPKQLDSYPKAARLAGTMSAVLGADGALTFSKLVITR